MPNTNAATVRMSDDLKKYTEPAKSDSLKAEHRGDIVIAIRETETSADVDVLPAFKFDGNVDSKQSQAMDKDHNLYLVEASNGEMVQVWMKPATYARYQKFTPDALPDQYKKPNSLNLAGLTRGIPGPKGSTPSTPSHRSTLFGPKPLRGVPIRLTGAILGRNSEFNAVMGMRREGGPPIKAVRIDSNVSRADIPAAKAKLAKAGYIPAKTQSGKLVYIQHSDRSAWVAAGGLVKD